MTISLYGVAEAHPSSASSGDFPPPLAQICYDTAHKSWVVLFKIEFHAVTDTCWQPLLSYRI